MVIKDHQSEETSKQGELFKKGKRSMTGAERVSQLQEKLYCKAKQEKDYKFYVLYDKMFVGYMLKEAYAQVKSNDGSPGLDGEDCDAVERYGLERYLHELGEDLRKQTYQPSAVKRVWIEKANGGKRPLGIPTIRDRIAQTVCKMILEPIFEADFEDSSYGYRPGRSSKDAMKAIKNHLKDGKTKVLDADLSSYFDTIPHDKLEVALRQRIADPRMLRLIKLWLKVPVNEDGEMKGGKKQKTGTPQGGVISPLLANVYLHLLDTIVNNAKRLFSQEGIKMVRYADDFILMGRRISEKVREALRYILERMELKLNETKTREIDATKTSFDFLGFTVRYDRDIKGRDNKYWNIIPSGKSEKRVREKVSQFLREHGHYAPVRIVNGLNPILRGWLNYYEVPKVCYPKMSQRKLRFYLLETLTRYYNRKSQRRSRLYGQQAFEVLVNNYRLINPINYSR